jgi:hypothetical protein
MRKPTLTGVILTLALVLGASLASAATDKRELQAREAFGAGRYQEALDLFVKLYAEKVHPNYLRNIGRCYQNLGEPDKAISSFREYLRQSKSVRPEERQEVEGYIKEMEDLKQQRAAAAATPPPETTGRPTADPTSDAPSGSSATKVSTKAPVPMAQNPDTTSQTRGTTLVQTPQPGSGQPPEPEDEAKPVYKRWWFWTLIGGAIVGGVAIAAAAGAFSTAQDARCPGVCP